jgi:uncharacterized protein YktB (UPF0637 family)
MRKLEIPPAFIDRVNEAVHAMDTRVKTNVLIRELYSSITIDNTKAETFFKKPKYPPTMEASFRKFIAVKEAELLAAIRQWIQTDQGNKNTTEKETKVYK